MTTAAERKHFGRVAELGCIVCSDLGFEGSPAEVHHLPNRGKRDHARVIPLCHTHHRDHGWGVSVHDGRRTWQDVYGTEESLLERTNARLGVYS